MDLSTIVNLELPSEAREPFEKACASNCIWDFHHGVYETALALERARIPIPTLVVPLLEKRINYWIGNIPDFGIVPESTAEILQSISNLANHIYALEATHDPIEHVNLCYTDLSRSGTEGDWLEERKVQERPGRYDNAIRDAKRKLIPEIFEWIARSSPGYSSPFSGFDGESEKKYFELAIGLAKELKIKLLKYRSAFERIVEGYRNGLENHKLSLALIYGSNVPEGFDIKAVQLPKAHAAVKEAAERYLAQDVQMTPMPLIAGK